MSWTARLAACVAVSSCFVLLLEIRAALRCGCSLRLAVRLQECHAQGPGFERAKCMKTGIWSPWAVASSCPDIPPSPCSCSDGPYIVHVRNHSPSIVSSTRQIPRYTAEVTWRKKGPMYTHPFQYPESPQRGIIHTAASPGNCGDGCSLSPIGIGHCRCTTEIQTTCCACMAMQLCRRGNACVVCYCFTRRV